MTTLSLSGAGEPRLADLCCEIECVRGHLDDYKLEQNVYKTEQHALCMRRADRLVAEFSQCLDDSDLKQLSRFDALQALFDDEQGCRIKEIDAISKRVELIEQQFAIAPKPDGAGEAACAIQASCVTREAAQLVARLRGLEASRPDAAEKLAGIRGRIFAAEQCLPGTPPRAPPAATDAPAAAPVPTPCPCTPVEPCAMPKTLHGSAKCVMWDDHSASGADLAVRRSVLEAGAM